MSDYQETLYQGYGQRFSIDNMLHEVRTEHQHLVIFENARMGRVMALDGVIQTTEADEFIYHEMLTHVPILAHGAARRVLIIGGGDGGMLREVAKHKSVERITMVEIDAGVVEFCRQYLPNHSAGAYDDPRFKLVIDDGVNFVNQTDETFDVIISDCTDPIGPGESLFTSAFYEGCARCLNEGGIFVAQNGVCFLRTQVGPKLSNPPVVIAAVTLIISARPGPIRQPAISIARPCPTASTAAAPSPTATVL